MENASKALIIAGAILISILLISVGILIFNSSKGTTDKATATSDLMSLEGQIAIIDMQFSKYNGKQNAETIKKMIEEIIEYNANNGSYNTPDETTTGYERKISLWLDPAIANNGGDSQSSTGHTTIVNWFDTKIKPYMDAKKCNTLKIETGKFLEPNVGTGRRSAIYLIRIKPN